MFNSINQSQWPLFGTYNDSSEEGTLIIADRLSSASGYDLGTANGASMLGAFVRIVDLETATAWISKYGFPWAADRVHFDDIGLENGVLLEDVIERSTSLSLLSRLVSIARGKSRVTSKDVLAWPVSSSPLADGYNLLFYNTWCELSQSMKRIGRATAKDLSFGRESTDQNLAIAFVPDKEKWCGFLMPPLFKAVEAVEDVVLSGVDFVPVLVPSRVGEKGFDSVVRYAAASLVADILPRLIRGVVTSVVCRETPSGVLNLAASRNFPNPFSVMGYELYKGLGKQADLLSCPRCGDWFSPRRKDQNSCGKDACSKWVQRRKE